MHGKQFDFPNVRYLAHLIAFDREVVISMKPWATCRLQPAPSVVKHCGRCFGVQTGLVISLDCSQVNVSQCSHRSIKLAIDLQEKNRALKYGGGMFLMVAVGTAIPVFAVWFQLKKAKG
jgi:hypothetical protein